MLPEINKTVDILIDKMWVACLNSTWNLNKIEKVVSKFFSIPVSNAFSEWIFTIMGNVWSDERSLLEL
jgi:hypothetical protein